MILSEAFFSGTAQTVLPNVCANCEFAVLIASLLFYSRLHQLCKPSNYKTEHTPPGGRCMFVGYNVLIFDLEKLLRTSEVEVGAVGKRSGNIGRETLTAA